MKNVKITGAVIFAVLMFFPSLSGAADDEQKISEKEVPAKVLAAFKANYPDATILGYTREKEDGQTVYEIEFKQSGTSFDVIYSPDGRQLILEGEISVRQLPEAIHEQLEKEFHSFDIALVEKIERDSTISYEVVVEDIQNEQQKVYELLFSEDGKLLSREEEKKEAAAKH